MTIRVLHCPTDTGRNAWTLAQAEKRLGIESTVLVFHNTWLNYPNDIDLKTRERSSLGKAAAIGGVMLKAVKDYDIIHFNGGRSLMKASPGRFPWISRADLAFFRAVRKGIVVTYQGCDVRQKSECVQRFGVNACDLCTSPCSLETDQHKAYMVEGFDRYAHAIFSLNPDLLWVLPDRAKFLPYTTIEPSEWEIMPPRPSQRGEPFVILHAPTNRGVKGTPCIIEAVEALKVRHPEVELLLVENVPHDGVKGLYERANLVIDQLLLGWYGGFAVEAMALGRPVLCYLREEDLHFISPEMRAELPLIKAEPGNLLEVLEHVLAHRDELPRLGERSRAFVEKWHDPLSIARGMKATYEEILQR